MAALQECAVKDFVVKSVCGTGGSARVFECAIQRIGFPFGPDYRVALKVMFNYGERTSMVERSTQNEFELLQDLPRHPNINAFLGQRLDTIPDSILQQLPDTVRDVQSEVKMGQYGGSGQSLKARLIFLRYHPMTLEQFIVTVTPSLLPFGIYISLARGLLAAELHLEKHQVLHLDAKPNNVLVDLSFPENPVAILCDFGCARRFQASWQLSRYWPTAAKFLFSS